MKSITITKALAGLILCALTFSTAYAGTTSKQVYASSGSINVHLTGFSSDYVLVEIKDPSGQIVAEYNFDDDYYGSFQLISGPYPMIMGVDLNYYPEIEFEYYDDDGTSGTYTVKVTTSGSAGSLSLSGF